MLTRLLLTFWMVLFIPALILVHSVAALIAALTWAISEIWFKK